MKQITRFGTNLEDWSEVLELVIRREIGSIAYNLRPLFTAYKPNWAAFTNWGVI